MRKNPRLGARSSAAAAALLGTCFLLAACSTGLGGGDSAPAAKAERGNGQRSGASDEGAGGTTGDGDTSGTSQTSARVLPEPRDIIYRGNITVRVKNVAAAADKVERIARTADGDVFAEEMSTEGPASEAHASLTLRVPPGEFRQVLRAVAGVGKRLHQSQTAEDVTTQVVDTESRIESQRRSVTRVRALLDQATTIGQVVQVESELARREADLESLEAQLERLKSVTSMATIEVTLVGTSAREPTAKDEELGFAEGFRGGWDAFVQVVLVMLTVLGALLPFAVTLGLLGVPAWLLLRMRLRLRRSAATELPSP